MDVVVDDGVVDADAFALFCRLPPDFDEDWSEGSVAPPSSSAAFSAADSDAPVDVVVGSAGDELVVSVVREVEGD